MITEWDFEYNNMRFEVEIDYDYDPPSHYTQGKERYVIPAVFRLNDVAVLSVTGYKSQGGIEYFKFNFGYWAEHLDAWAFNYIESNRDELSWLYDHLVRDV